MIDRTEALALLEKHAGLMEEVHLDLSGIDGHVLARDLVAASTVPAADMSAMDGYAIRFADLIDGQGGFRVIAETAAGSPSSAPLGPAEAVRVFTGSVMPPGADHVVIQEDVSAGDARIEIRASQERPRNIRRAGVDFCEGDLLIPAGTPLGPMELGVAASANQPGLRVRRKPKIAILANGNELILPGTPAGPASVICSTPFALGPLIRNWGADADFVGIAEDSEASIRAFIEKCRGADIIIPLGGASVGDHDHMQSAFRACGLAPVFSKVAIRPGKPTWFGMLEDTRVLGLPGNPASALVCAILFLKPLIAAMLGVNMPGTGLQAVISTGLAPNGPRETFLRARMERGADAAAHVTPVSNQDTSVLSPFLAANVLIRRAANAPAVPAGARVLCIPFKQ